MFKLCRVQKLVVWLFILALPLGLAKDAVFAPFLLQVIDDFHKVSLDIEHGELHLTLHHGHEKHGKSTPDRNGDGYELISSSHQFDGFNNQHPPHHEFHAESFSAQTITSKINSQTENDKTQKLAALALSASSLDQITPISTKSLFKTPPEVKSEFPGIRTTVLLI